MEQSEGPMYAVARLLHAWIENMNREAAMLIQLW